MHILFYEFNRTSLAHRCVADRQLREERKIIGASKIARDITQRKLSEEQIMNLARHRKSVAISFGP